jgi:hypothetical protein
MLLKFEIFAVQCGVQRHPTMSGNVCYEKVEVWLTRMMLSLKRVTKNGHVCKRGFVECGTLRSDKHAS